MADDIPQDQTKTTEPAQQQTVPPADQPPVEIPTAQPTPDQSPTNPVDTSINQTNPKPLSDETKTEIPIPAETPPPVPPPVLNIPALHYPFSGNFPVTFSFGQQSDNEEIKKKFQEWGIVGHNGLDFGLSAGNDVFACDVGKVIQSGDNGDFGTSITIQHSWGQSIYGHLQETKVKEGDEIQINKVIGLSGSSGAAFGEHLHFAIKPNNPDLNNGYLGFIDPAPFLTLPSKKEEPKQETPPVEEQKPLEPITPQSEVKQEPPKPEETQQPPAEEVPPPIKLEPEKPAVQTEQPQQPETPQIPQVSDEEIQKQVDEKFKTELDSRRQKANEARSQKKEDHLTKIFEFVRDKKVVTNEDIRDFLHVSQSTATNYLTEMVNRGMLKKEGERGGAKYSI
ncbi:MAG: peptidoglycan DD-metalloendopeptidase family protein [Patescibacteria group bacterium]